MDHFNQSSEYLEKEKFFKKMFMALRGKDDDIINLILNCTALEISLLAFFFLN